MDSATHGPRPDRPIAILAVTRHGVSLALQLQAKLPGSVCYVPVRHQFALAMGAKGFERIGSVLQEIWPHARALVCIMATGIVVRRIAPLLRHKSSDPAVVVLDEAGRFAISLVSGHLGGANRLAAEIARLIGAQAVITTASDVEGKPAIDLIAREAGLEIENPRMVSRLERAILEEEPFRIFDPDGWLDAALQGLPNAMRCEAAGALCGSTVRSGPEFRENKVSAIQPEVGLWVSERLAPETVPWLVLRPQNLVVGLGCNRNTPCDEIVGFIREVFERERLSLASIRNLASIDVKSDEIGLLDAAQTLNRPIHFYGREDLAQIDVPHPSEIVRVHIGVPSVCEATALLSARSHKLLIPKQKTPNVTLAVARVASRS